MFRLRLENDVAHLTMERSQARNAIPTSGWPVLSERLGEAERSGVRLLVLSGTDGVFCAGADLGDFPRFRQDATERAEFRTAMRAALDRLATLSIPTIAAVEGACYGAGVALALHCDVRVADPGARFAITPARLGISYPLEDVHRLVTAVGQGQAARLLLTAAPIDADEAARIGLVELVGGGAVLTGLVADILAGAGVSHAALRDALRVVAGECRSDPATLDGRFDDLLGGDEMARRLEQLRRK